MGAVASLSALYWTLAFSTNMVAVLGTTPWWASRPRLLPLDEFFVDTALPYFGTHVVGILAMVAAAAIIMTVRLTPGRRIACLALAAVFVELGTQWPYVTDWLRDVRINLTYGQTKFHVFSVLPEVAVWIGAPLAAAVVSGIIMNWLWTPRSGVRGGPTRS